MAHEFDIIIAGAGSSGCALAGRLSEDPKIKVLLLEAGPWDDSPFIKMPKGLTKLRANRERVYHYEAERSTAGLDLQAETMLRGRGLGGSSTINGMVYHRGQPQDYDDWEALGLPGWGWRDVLPAFLAIEDNRFPQTPWRGPGGPLPLRTSRRLPRAAEALISAAQASGLPRKEEPNLPDQRGISPVAENIDKRGQRVTAAHAFLPPAVRRRPNLTIMVDTRVDRILFNGRQAIALECLQAGEKRVFRSSREIVLSLGALESPRLLQVSGVGPAEHLSRIGIAPVADLPGVGANYRDHFCYPSFWRLRHRRDSQNREFSGWRLPVNVLRHYLLGAGPLSTSVAQLSLFAEVMPGNSGRPDVELLWFPWNMRLGTTAANIELDPEPGCTFSGFPLRGNSEGTVLAASSAADAPPIVRPNYLSTEYDRQVMVGLARLSKALMLHPAMAPFVVGAIGESGHIESEDEILDYCRRYGVSAQHSCGTCKMGPMTDAMAVVDEALRVHGVQGLRVADCSIMPLQLSANTNGPAMMIGWRAAEFVKADLTTD